jgi:type II secretory pathway pseudopilin PulG
MKGVEALPLRLTASIILIAVVVGVAFYELNAFMDFQKVKTFKEDLIDVRQAMRTLQSLGDEGSFTSVTLTVPTGYSVFINNATDQLIGNLGGEVFTVNLTGSLIALSFPAGCMPTGCLLGPADYELRLAYGMPQTLRDYTIVFV